jgi:hypothetical protein
VMVIRGGEEDGGWRAGGVASEAPTGSCVVKHL